MTNYHIRTASLTKTVVLVLTILAFVATVSVPVFGQVSTNGTVSGTVTDPSGAIVPGAKITLTDTSTKNTLSTVTNESGHYILLNVTNGVYNIEASKTGYFTAKVSAVTVNVGTAISINISMKVGASSQIVEVTANGTELQTMNSTVGNTIDKLSIDSLPTLNRDISTFVTLQPGVSPSGAVAGVREDESTFMLDGGQNTSDMDGGMTNYTGSFAGSPTGVAAGGPSGVIPTNIDSLEEFKINTSNQTADFNNSDGAQVSFVTKRGTSAWHGTGYEYYLDNNFNANTWQNNFRNVPLTSYHYSRFGASVGGPIINKPMLGGKTYVFFNFEGFRFPNTENFDFATPSANMRLGILTFGGVEYNLNPTVTNDASGTPVPSAVCPGLTTATNPNSLCDPRLIGLNTSVKQLWASMPAANAPCNFSRCTDPNVGDFNGNVAVPQKSNIGVARLDHDFGSKQHFNTVYHYYNLQKTSDCTVQCDIGGLFPGDTVGQVAALGSRPQQAWSLVGGWTSNITSNVTNEFHYNYLRNWWKWNDIGQSNAQISSLGGALEIGGEAQGSTLIPYNINTQAVRQRYWNGHDNFFSDNVSILKGNHFIQFGGQYQHNWDAHQRTDNGGGIDYQPVYEIGLSSGSTGINGIQTGSGGYTPAGLSAGNLTNWGLDYMAVLGMISQTQQVYTRSGANLTLNPPLTPAEDQSVIPLYNVYFGDSWHMKPNFTFTYGMGWTLEMPPVEAQGRQVELIDQSGALVGVQAYLNQRQQAALQGQVYNPILGYDLVGNAAGGLKYPYNPFYGSFSPRAAFAWNPRFDNSILKKIFGEHDSVIRGGYNRIYGRLNGVDLVLVPLLGDGLMQAVACVAPQSATAGNGSCNGGATTTPATAFRIGPNGDGNVAPLPAPSATLPQPVFPGLLGPNYGSPTASIQASDPNFRPPAVDSIDLTIQRQIGSKITLEVGYIGHRITHEYAPINLNSVPYMMTEGGQTFANAYAYLETAIGCATSYAVCGTTLPNTVAAANSLTPQPFFENAATFGGSASAYCTTGGYTSCTAAVFGHERSNLNTQKVWSLWSDLDNGKFLFPRTMMNTPIVPGNSATVQNSAGIGVNASIGYGNYNAGFIQMKTSDWHGLTMQQNFTWSKALGTNAQTQASSALTADDAFNLAAGYGPQAFDRKYVYNLFFVYQPTLFRGKSGWQGRILDNWNLSPIFTAGSGIPLQVSWSGSSQALGTSDGTNFTGVMNAIFVGPYTGGNSMNSVPTGTQVNGVTLGGLPLNMFTNPNAVYNEFRPAILGLDTRVGGDGIIRGMPYWNMDFSLRKTAQIYEHIGAEFQLVVTNIFNHVNYANPSLTLSSPSSFGVSGGQGNNPRQLEFGFRLRF